MASSKSQAIVVPLVQRDLHDHDLVKDMVWQLKRLEAAVDDVFSNIADRVKNERKRLAEVNARSERCRELVSSIQGSSKATTVGYAFAHSLGVLAVA
jgi:hypothetical protein